jgi:NADH-quinone oxidoreductase subunit E
MEGLFDKNELNKIVEKYPKDKRHCLAIMQDIQRKFGFLPRDVFEILAAYLNVKTAQLYSMATFYRAFSLVPKGKHTIKVCDGTACHIKGAPVLLDALKRVLGINAGETTKDGMFTVETVNCVGACAIAPVMVVDGHYHPKVKPDEVDMILRTYRGAGNE